ncbi:Lcl C-terminal domain-containing protein [Labilibacter marinus]|uniref:Lcl C-terminal domain-containing protein n=1 Tax=Labilibacter marinus TaxID=1477105 RepID=UPI000A58282F|nr:DUF1566 domain-containing protein [Labilibacter marinus]
MIKPYITLLIIAIGIISCDKDDTPEVDDSAKDNTPNDKEIVLSMNYPIVDTKQTTFYNNTSAIASPQAGDDFYGQDAQFVANTPSYTSNSDGTVTDNVTGLIWEKTYQRMGHTEALAYLAEKNKGTHNDWRIPSIKELYSLMQFNGTDVSGADMESAPPASAIPFIDNNYFNFDYFANGDRSIDVQYYSSSKYTGYTMNNSESLFGLNVADGRIKGYPYMSRGVEKDYSVKLVRGNTNYGKNEFVDNNNNTISDKATGLMWDKNDSALGMEWAEALAWANKMNAENHLGYNDWRVPNAKELHSIVDYTRSPQATNSAAIDPVFNISKITVEGGLDNYPFFWSSTTHLNLQSAASAVYICFGEALGFFPEGTATPIDVHGAGAQRSDPKTDNGKDYSAGHGPQGDVVRFDNYVRLVRTIEQE